MFAEAAVAARIERAESSLSRDIGTLAVAGGRTPDAFLEPVGGGVAVFAGAGSPVNKLIGAGFEGPPDPGDLARVEARFAAVGAPVQAEVSTLADPAWHAAFGPRGYAVAGFENVLGLDLAGLGARQAPGLVTVTEWPASQAAAWIDVVATGFQHPDDVPAQAAGQEFPREAIERVFMEFAGAPGFRLYAAIVDGVVAGGGGLREHDGVAQLCGAATLPAFRRRGVQSALLDARLHGARARGCDLAVITTAPGSKSMQNALRRGFALLYARALHIREGGWVSGR